MNFGLEQYKAIVEPLLKIVDPRTGIVRALIETVRYNDEPKLYQITALMCNPTIFSDARTGGSELQFGMSLNRERAMLMALGEAIERYCSLIYRTRDFFVSSYKEIEEKALDPRNVVSFSKNQLTNEKFNIFKFDETTKFRWVKGYSLTQNRPIYVPAQLVYLNYNYMNGEPIIRFPMSSGLGAGESLARALCRGICEAVERDAFLITYLNILPRDQIEIEGSQNKHIVKLAEIFKKYKLDLYVYDITTDIEIPSILSILIDRSGVGPAVTTGTAASLDLESAIIRSMEEVQQKRSGYRPMSVNLFQSIDRWDQRIAPWYIANLARTKLWSKIDMIYNLNFLLINKNRKKIESLENPSHRDIKKDLESILGVFKVKNMEVSFVDLTTPDIDEIGFKVVRVIIPELQPLYMYEDFKYLGSRRLYQVPKILGYKQRETSEDVLNQIPYP